MVGIPNGYRWVAPMYNIYRIPNINRYTGIPYNMASAGLGGSALLLAAAWWAGALAVAVAWGRSAGCLRRLGLAWPRLRFD